MGVDSGRMGHLLVSGSIAAEASVKKFEATEGNTTLCKLVIDANLKWVHGRIVAYDKLV